MAMEIRRKKKEKKVVRKIIWPAIIRSRYCPICYTHLESHYKEAAVLVRCNHSYCTHCITRWSEVRTNCPLCNSHFDSFFSILSLSSSTFRIHSLPSPPLHHHHPPSSTRVVGRRGTSVDRTRMRRRALPWRRSFGRPGFVTPDVIALRKLQWRASIYNNEGLRPDPATLRCVEQRCKGCSPCSLFISMLQQHLSPNISKKDAVKREILLRIEPWIRRELQAVLGDPDPTVIVHVVTSQFIAWLEEKARLPSGQHDAGDSFILPLRPFLHDKTSTFWHELSCFAEGCYKMETYDAVVEYKQQE